MPNEKERSVRVVKGMPDVQLSAAEFLECFSQRFYDPAFDFAKNEFEKIATIAYEAYKEYRKSPRTKPAGPGFEDPEFPLPVEWLETRKKIADAEQLYRNSQAKSGILLINGAASSDQTCPGEMLTDMELIPAGPNAGLARYVGYYTPYATSHDDLDRDTGLQTEVKNHARALIEMVRQIRNGKNQRPDANLEEPRKK
ncbi:hypothetical protein L0156_09580 [bacterium]|nr:hypothetical protein [bacterium]